MRSVVEGLDSAAPLLQQLPGVYQDDMFTQRFLSAFDAALAPVVATLDDLHAYVDPFLTPDDFLDWLAGWVAVELDERSDETSRRQTVARAVTLHRQRGTVRGIQGVVALASGVSVEVSESGAAVWSRSPGLPLPGDPVPSMTVKVHASDPSTVDVEALSLLVTAAKPAHVEHTIEVVEA